MKITILDTMYKYFTTAAPYLNLKTRCSNKKIIVAMINIVGG